MDANTSTHVKNLTLKIPKPGFGWPDQSRYEGNLADDVTLYIYHIILLHNNEN